jgi:dTDP-4-dehydrorhamnose 3,5-epimerase-like enzyme
MVGVERLMTRISDCHLVELPKIKDHRGNLTFIEGGNHVGFDIKRVYYLYDVPGGETRAGHAHRAMESVIIAINGSFDVVLDDGRERSKQRLSRANEGLYLCRGIWRELDNFTSGSVCLVLASTHYDEGDYYREYADFVEAVARGVFAS